MNSESTRTDRGSILPLVLIVSVVFSMVMVSLATYATAGLRYAAVVEARADRLAAADGGLRFAIEKLRLNQSLCTTRLGSGSGYAFDFPPDINGADTVVRCQRIAGDSGDLQGWGVVVTGGTGGSGTLATQGGTPKSIGGPVFLHDPTKLDLQGGTLTLENGDLWYTDSDCPSSTFPANSGLQFSPSFLRGPICVEQVWSDLVTAPTAAVPTNIPAVPVVDTTGCKVFSPGKYTASNNVAPGQNTYFKSGNYYFENTVLDIKAAIVTAGFADGRYGDTRSFANTPCASSILADAARGGEPGVTIYLGGSAYINVDTDGALEVMRRRQVAPVVSVQALDSPGAGYIASTLGVADRIVDVKAGSQQDAAFHGLVWAPRAGFRLSNTANKSRGMLLGGLVIAHLEAQASNGTGLMIRVEGGLFEARILLTATATKDGHSSSIRSVVQIQPDSDYLAINSWRVVD